MNKTIKIKTTKETVGETEISLPCYVNWKGVYWFIRPDELVITVPAEKEAV